MPEWEEIPVPRGSYIGWGNTPGQHVTGKVLDYDPTGATDFDDKPCPGLEIELTEAADSYNKALERTTFDAGETVQLSCGLVSLRKAVRKADLHSGDLVKITMFNIEPLKGGKTVKEFGIKVARGGGNGRAAAGNSAATTASVGGRYANDEPPF